jgi:ribonuclease D
MKKTPTNLPAMIRQFDESVTDEDLKKLPVVQFEGSVKLIDSIQKFRQALSEISRCKILGFDTETRPSFKKGTRHKVSLLQLADDRNAWLFRLNMIGLPPELTALLASPDIIKVGVAVHDDIKALRHLEPFEPGGFVDLQTVVAAHGIKQLGLKKLSAIILGFSISKSQQTSNWEAPGLTLPQQVYAATDAWVCRRIYMQLNRRRNH